MDKAVLSRRSLLAGGATVAGVAALGVGAAGPAEAATASIKKVVMYRVGRFTYSSRTHVSWWTGFGCARCCSNLTRT